MIDDFKDGGSVHKFLCQSCLYWLEALSLIKSLSIGVVLIRKFENWLQVSFSTLFEDNVRRLNLSNKAAKSPDLFTFIHDAKRLVLYSD